MPKISDPKKPPRGAPASTDSAAGTTTDTTTAAADTTDTTTGVSVQTMTIAELNERVAEARDHVAQARALLPGLIRLTTDQRITSNGKLRSGEGVALGAVLDGVDYMPAPFQVLAKKDFGVDDNRFETELLRDRLQRGGILAPLSGETADLGALLSDTTLLYTEQSKGPILDAYDIAKPLAGHDSGLQTHIVKTLNYYSGIAKKSARTRKENAENAAPATSTTTAPPTTTTASSGGAATTLSAPAAKPTKARAASKGKKPTRARTARRSRRG